MPSTANRSRVGVIREIIPGTIPAAPAFQTVRFKSNGLTAKPKLKVSEEVRSDGMQADTAIVGKDVGGSLALEFTNKTADILIEEAIRSVFTKSPEVNGATAVAAGTGVYTFTAGPAFIIGHYVRCTGFTNAANNGYFRVTAQTGTTITTDNAASVAEAAPPATSRIKAVGYKAAVNGDIQAVVGSKIQSVLNPATFGLVPGMWFQCINFATGADNGFYRVQSIAGAGPYTITCDVVPTGFAADAAAAAKVVIAFTDYDRNGTTRLTHATEKALLDATGGAVYDYRLGDQVDQLTIDMQDDDIIQLTAACKGMDTIAPANAQFAAATNVAPGTSPVINTSTGLPRIAEALANLIGGASNLPLATKVMIKGNLRDQSAAGQVALAGLGFGTLEVTGEIDIYLDSPAYLAKLWNNTKSSYDVRFVDANGDGYIIDIPTIKYEDGDNPSGAQNSDIVPKMSFRGLVTAPAAGNPYVIHVQKFELVQ